MARNYDQDRLGGPPGLFDSPNRERESTGGIVQRVRVPDAPKPEGWFEGGPFSPYSLNDSDEARDAMGMDDHGPIETLKSLEEGIPFRKDISGDKM